MKPQLHKLPLAGNTSFLYNQWDCQYFNKPWHFHEEYELVWIRRSEGTKFIGDHISYFREGDLFLIGSNIPHLFRNNEDYYDPGTVLQASSIFIHFTEESLGTGFFDLPELKSVRELLDRSAYALQINGSTRDLITGKLMNMQDEVSPRRLISLIEILVLLSESRETQALLANPFTQKHTTTERDTSRIQKVLEYVMKNFQHDLYMPDVAALLNMSEASFSRYFKQNTQKTFSCYLTEVRISNACRLLMQGEENISQIAYLCGFENISNFYRHFKKITGMVPKEYRHRFYEVAE
jgi:AraC-like DNA-binding protein